jgi:hypothetical protein
VTHTGSAGGAVDGHIKGEWPHLEDITDPVVLEAELARVRIEYNSVRLHEAIDYVTPDDEHEGRGEQIGEARRPGLTRARQQRLEHHRQHNKPEPRGDTVTWFISSTISAAKSDTPQEVAVCRRPIHAGWPEGMASELDMAHPTRSPDRIEGLGDVCWASRCLAMTTRRVWHPAADGGLEWDCRLRRCLGGR